MNNIAQKLPPGYKQTEIGVIPEDWIIKPFRDIVTKFIDYRGVTPKKLGMNWGNGDICALSANNVQMGYIDFEKECYLASKTLYKRWMRNGDCSQGDILLTMEAPLGNVASIPDQKKYILSQRTILIKPREFIEKNFLRHMMSGSYFQRSLSENASGSTAQGIQRKKLEKITLYYPKSKPEQTAIAKVLSDSDALIENLEKLIDKKKKIKQGAMQELLTGKRRLPGFSGEWEVKKLGETSEMNSGGTPSSKVKSYYGGHVLWASIADMTSVGKYISDTEKKLTNSGLTNSSAKIFSENTILYAMYASIGECCIALKPIATSQAILGIRCSKQLNNVFLYYYLTSIKDNVKLLGQQGTQSNLNKGMVENFKLKLPKFQEQTAITTVLSDMDAEIEVLEKKRDKYQQIKQGMMQQLLTGKIRLV